MVVPQDYNEAEIFLSPSDAMALDYKWFAKDVELVIVNKAVVEMANDFIMGVDETDWH